MAQPLLLLKLLLLLLVLHCLPLLQLLLQVLHVCADGAERVLDAVAEAGQGGLQRQLHLNGPQALGVRLEQSQCSLLTVDLIPAVNKLGGSLQLRTAASSGRMLDGRSSIVSAGCSDA